MVLPSTSGRGDERAVVAFGKLTIYCTPVLLPLSPTLGFLASAVVMQASRQKRNNNQTVENRGRRGVCMWVYEQYVLHTPFWPFHSSSLRPCYSFFFSLPASAGTFISHVKCCPCMYPASITTITTMLITIEIASLFLSPWCTLAVLGCITFNVYFPNGSPSQFISMHDLIVNIKYIRMLCWDCADF